MQFKINFMNSMVIAKYFIKAGISQIENPAELDGLQLGSWKIVRRIRKIHNARFQWYSVL